MREQPAGRMHTRCRVRAVKRESVSVQTRVYKRGIYTSRKLRASKRFAWLNVWRAHEARERVREEAPLSALGMLVPKGPQSRPPDIVGEGGGGGGTTRIFEHRCEERWRAVLAPMNRPTRDTFRSSDIWTCVKKQSWNDRKKRGVD